MGFTSRELMFYLTSPEPPAESCLLLKITCVPLMAHGGVVRTEPDALREMSL